MADLNKHQQNMKDLSETRKRKLSDNTGGAGTIESNYTELKPTTFKEKWDNYWYHHKTATFVGFIIITLILVSIIDAAKIPDYDAGLAFVTEIPFDANADFIVAEWKELCDDFYDDGDVNVETFAVQLDVYNKYSMDAEMAQANVTKFMGNVAVMNNFIYVVDEVGYSSLLEVGCILADLSYWFGLEDLEDCYRYPLKGTNLAEKVGIGNVLDDMYLCMISFEDLPEARRDNADINVYYTKDFFYLINLINYG